MLHFKLLHQRTLEIDEMSTWARNLNAGLNLSSKLAVVAGGSRGIGRGIAIRLAKVRVASPQLQQQEDNAKANRASES